MVRKWPAEHGRELHSNPKVFVTAEAYLSTTFGPNISDSSDWVSIVRGWISIFALKMNNLASFLHSVNLNLLGGILHPCWSNTETLCYPQQQL